MLLITWNITSLNRRYYCFINFAQLFSSYTIYAQLERKIDTGYRSIKENCEELQYFGQVNIETIGKHPANGRVSYQVSITLQGLDTLRKRKITI